MFHNVYGPPCDYGERSQVIPALIRKAVNYPEEPFNVWGSGLQGRAFIHVDDVVEALCLALEKGWGHGYIQIGPSVCTSIKEIAETVVKISGKDIEIVYDTTKPEGDKARSADYTKAKTILGWEPKIALEDGLRQQYEWVKSQIEKSGCHQNSKGFFRYSSRFYFPHVGLKTVLLSSQETSSSLTQIAIKNYIKVILWILMCILPWMSTIILWKEKGL